MENKPKHYSTHAHHSEIKRRVQQAYEASINNPNANTNKPIFWQIGIKPHLGMRLIHKLSTKFHSPNDVSPSKSFLLFKIKKNRHIPMIQDDRIPAPLIRDSVFLLFSDLSDVPYKSRQVSGASSAWNP